MKKILNGVGITLIVLSFVVLITALWETFGSAGRALQVLEAPGYKDLDLDTPGLYAGVYQHQGDGPIPAEELSKLDVRIISKETYQDIPVLMNNSGQTFSRLGVRGMPLFNVLIEKPGFYSFSALYKEGVAGPTVPILLISQATQTAQSVLLVGGFFFLVFLSLGIFLLIKAKRI